MKLKVTDNQQLDNKEIIKVFNNIKISFNETIKNEEKKEFLITLSDFVCNDLIRRGNLINNRKNILRPLSPHLPIYKPQLTSTFPIYHRISGAFLATLVLFFYLLCDPFGVWDSFLSVGSQVSLRLGGRALSFFLIKMGCSGGLFSRPLEVEGRAQV